MIFFISPPLTTPSICIKRLFSWLRTPANRNNIWHITDTQNDKVNDLPIYKYVYKYVNPPKVVVCYFFFLI